MWTYTLLPQILNMSLTASIVILLVLLARLPLKKAPRVFSYALWAVVLFRLVCPVSFSSHLSLIGLFPTPAAAASGSTYSSINYIPADIVHTEFPQVNLPLPGISDVINDNLPQGKEQLVADPLEAPMAAATFLWLFGLSAMLIYSAESLLRLRQKLLGAVRLRGNIYLADHIPSPFVIGLFHPKIYLPSTLPEEEQSYVILHEQTHIRRLDHIFKMLAFLALAVHWFNPLVWVAFICCVKDMEMSCDEHVLKQMGGDIKGAYGASLLSLATGRRLINGSPLAFGEGNIKERIKNIMNFKKPPAWVIVISALVVIIAAGCLLANPIKNSKSPNASIQDIDIRPFTYIFTSRIVESPDKQHSVQVTIYKETEDSGSAYIMGNIGSLDDTKGYTKDSRTIFWQKIDSNSIKAKIIDGKTLNNWIEVAWLDIQNININGISLNINNVYDFRRDLVAYVDETLSETQARALQSKIEQNPNVENADFVTREEALQIFEAKYADKSLFEDINPSVFRHRYNIYVRDTSLTKQTANDIAQIAGIARVNTGTSA